jgi:hypothetical protein
MLRKLPCTTTVLNPKTCRKALAGLAMTAATVGAGGPVAAAPVLFAVGGSNAPASIQGTVDAFRAALGDPNNANAPGPLASGRREINWDGGGSTANSPGGTPFDVFLNTRGGRFVTPDGTGFLQAPPSGGTDGGAAAFFNNANYGDTFGFFSPTRVFTPVASTTTQGLFFIPGTMGGVPAEISGFGAVFSDVDLASRTKIDYFDSAGTLLTEQFVPAGTTANQSLSFLGVVFDAGEKISRVEITTGTNALSMTADDNPAGGIDLVVMDDVLYGEPTQAQVQVPEPATWGLVGAAAMALVGIRRHRRRVKSL